MSLAVWTLVDTWKCLYGRKTTGHLHMTNGVQPLGMFSITMTTRCSYCYGWSVKAPHGSHQQYFMTFFFEQDLVSRLHLTIPFPFDAPVALPLESLIPSEASTVLACAFILCALLGQQVVKVSVLGRVKHWFIPSSGPELAWRGAFRKSLADPLDVDCKSIRWKEENLLYTPPLMVFLHSNFSHCGCYYDPTSTGFKSRIKHGVRLNYQIRKGPV